MQSCGPFRFCCTFVQLYVTTTDLTYRVYGFIKERNWKINKKGRKRDVSLTSRVKGAKIRNEKKTGLDKQRKQAQNNFLAQNL